MHERTLRENAIHANEARNKKLSSKRKREIAIIANKARQKKRAAAQKNFV